MKNQILGLSLLSAVLAMPAATASAQGTLEDYNRAYALRHQFSADSVFHWARSSAWCDSTHVLHYQISTPQGKKYVQYCWDHRPPPLRRHPRTYHPYPHTSDSPCDGRAKEARSLP